MDQNHFLALVLTMLAICCSDKEPGPEKLIGVWSGQLFQTEPKYDSIILVPAIFPEEAHLYKDGQKTIHPLLKEGSALGFKGPGGLRFDASWSDHSSLNGILTLDLWAKSLNFEKKSDQWIARVNKPEIIDTDYLVYLEFYLDSTQQLQAIIQSNKENREVHFTIEQVTLSGNEISFGITNERFGLSAVHDPAKEVLSLNYRNPGSSRTIELKRVPPGKYTGYIPTSQNQNYVYQPPEPVNEEIQSAALDEMGIDTSIFLGFMEEMNSGKYDHIHSIIVTKNNKFVFEEYFHGYHREYLHDIRSAFKSLASLTVGKAMMEDNELQLDNRILDYYRNYKETDPRKEEITIRHALTMSTGISLEDEDEMQWKHNDWVAYKLDLPMATNPGTKFEYSSGGTHLLTGVIQESTNIYLPLFIYDRILRPLGIDRFQMLTSPRWRGYLAGSCYLRPIDFAKIGLLVLNRGRWNGQQIIAESWIAESTRPHIKGSWPPNSDYGYLWRVLERKIGGKPMKTVEAWGNGGQFLIVIPEVEMTITMTGGNYNLFPQMEDRPFSLLNQYILPSVVVENH